MKKEIDIIYAPLEDITAYEVARVVDVQEYYRLVSYSKGRYRYTVDRIEHYKLGRHFKFDGVRGK